MTTLPRNLRGRDTLWANLRRIFFWGTETEYENDLGWFKEEYDECDGFLFLVRGTWEEFLKRIKDNKRFQVLAYIDKIQTTGFEFSTCTSLFWFAPWEEIYMWILKGEN